MSRFRPRGPVATALAVAKLGFVVWAVVELVGGRPGKAVALLAMFAVLQVPPLLKLPAVFDLTFLIAWTLQALGQVAGFWSRFPWWDTLVHAALPAVLAPTAMVLLGRLGILPDPFALPNRRRALGLVLLVFLVAAGLGTVYELYEWFSDSNFGTNFQPNNADTMTDIAANDVGGLVGGLWLMAYSLTRRSRAADGPQLPSQSTW